MALEYHPKISLNRSTVATEKVIARSNIVDLTYTTN